MLHKGWQTVINRMYNDVKKYYYWNYVETFVQKCDSRSTFQLFTLISTAFQTLNKIMLDLVWCLELGACGYKYILTIQCVASKFEETYLLSKKASVTVAKSLVNVYKLNSYTRLIIIKRL